jgi:hypothetical protein
MCRVMGKLVPPRRQPSSNRHLEDFRLPIKEVDLFQSRSGDKDPSRPRVSPSGVWTIRRALGERLGKRYKQNYAGSDCLNG